MNKNYVVCSYWYTVVYLTIIPQTQMGSESIAHVAEGEKNSCFSKIQLVGSKYQDKTTLASTECDSAAIVLVFKAGAFCYN